MLILPAIDLRGGRCVRLERGDFQKETIFDDDPTAVARRFEADGAEWLHVVDLDGARSGTLRNLQTIDAMIRAVQISVEVGGGIGSDKAVADVLATGAHRLIIGTQAVVDLQWVAGIIRLYPHRVAVSIDAHLRPDRKQLTPSADAEGGGTTTASSFLTTASSLAVRGWQQDSGRRPKELLDGLHGLPIAAIICTDISRDGMMSSLDVEAVRSVVQEYPNFPVIASGGVTTVDDVRRLKAASAAGAIIGRALYEGKLTLKAALEAAGEP